MHSIPKLDKKGLRDFGLIFGAIVAVIFGLIFPWFKGEYPLWPWIIAGIFWAWALIAPTTLNPVYQIWMRFGLILGWIETRIILGLVFYGLIMPMGLIMRLILNRDPMHRSLDTTVKTYRVQSQKRLRESMEKPF